MAKGPNSELRSAAHFKGGGAPIYTDEQILELFREHRSTRKVAGITGHGQRYVRQRLAEIRKKYGHLTEIGDVDRSEKAERLLGAIPREAAGGGKLKEASVTVYGNAAFDKTKGEWVEQGLDSTKGVYIWKPETPRIPIVTAGPPVKIAYRPAPSIMRKTRIVVVVSDIQAGWLKDPETHWLTPIHDPTAVDVGVQITEAVAPNGLVFIGDAADWQFLSRWRQYREYDAANPSIKTATNILGLFCSASGKRTEDDRTVIGSNHGDRPELWMVERNLFASGICRGGDTSEWPVFSEPYLLKYDDMNLKLSGHYGSQHWITRDLVAIHAPPKPREFEASVFHGHTHHLRITPQVTHGKNVRRERFIYDTGCLCRTDATTDKRRLVLLNVPSNQHRSDWTQGLAVINIVEDKEPIHSVELIHIQNGRALYRGQEFSASAEARKILAEGVKAA